MWFSVSILVIIIDQLSKYIAMTTLDLYQAHAIIPMLNFTLAYNSGAAFSFLSGAGAWHHWFFAAFSFIVSIGVIVWMSRLSMRMQQLQIAALSLILGGALGNLIDRLILGYVIDFIDIYYGNYHWPIFNIADSAITIGSILLAFDLCRQRDVIQA